MISFYIFIDYPKKKLYLNKKKCFSFVHTEMHRYSHRKGILRTERGPKGHLQLFGMISFNNSSMRFNQIMFFNLEIV